jgi:hypothetical protein
MDDEEEQQLPPFRWNKQAVFMVCFFAVALAIPFAGVLMLANGFSMRQPPPKPEAQVDTTSLVKGLEKMSDEHCSSTALTKIQDGVEIEVGADDVVARSMRISQTARFAGGSALDMSKQGAKSRRLLVQVPASRMDLFKRAIRGEPVDFSAIPAGAETQLLEVELKVP